MSAATHLGENVFPDLAAQTTGIPEDRVRRKLPEIRIVVRGQVEGDGWIEHGTGQQGSITANLDTESARRFSGSTTMTDLGA